MKALSQKSKEQERTAQFIKGVQEGKPREVGVGILQRRDIKVLLSRINTNDKEHTVVLKVKECCSGDINQLVMDEILGALFTKNTVCQAAYLQNLGTFLSRAGVA